MEEATVCIFWSERKYGLTIIFRDEHFAIWWSIKKIRIEILIYCMPLLTIVQMVSSNTVCTKSNWQCKLIHFFRQGLFKDFSGPYFAKCCFESYSLGRNTCTCRNARQELETTCKPDIRCALVAQWTCAAKSDERTMGTKKQVFSHIL